LVKNKIIQNKVEIVLKSGKKKIKLKQVFMGGPLNGVGVRDAILNQGKTATESSAYFLGECCESCSGLHERFCNSR